MVGSACGESRVFESFLARPRILALKLRPWQDPRSLLEFVPDVCMIRYIVRTLASTFRFMLELCSDLEIISLMQVQQLRSAIADKRRAPAKCNNFLTFGLIR